MQKIKAETIRIYMITPLGRAKENKEICTEEMNCVDIDGVILDFQDRIRVYAEWYDLEIFRKKGPKKKEEITLGRKTIENCMKVII